MPGLLRPEVLKSQCATQMKIYQYSESVLTTWETTYDAVHKQSPEASTLMSMLSILSFDEIFLELSGIDRQTGKHGIDI